jgi:hypothetical protein
VITSPNKYVVVIQLVKLSNQPQYLNRFSLAYIFVPVGLQTPKRKKESRCHHCPFKKHPPGNETPAFIQKQPKMTNCRILDWKGVCLVDGKPVLGTDWETPVSQLVEATVVIDGHERVKLDISCMFNPWAERPREKDFGLHGEPG